MPSRRQRFGAVVSLSMMIRIGFRAAPFVTNRVMRSVIEAAPEFSK
jgi:hypothetical protein